MKEDGATLIKENLRLPDLAGRYIQLKKRGNKLIACCPFHSEKTPSFHIDPQKDLYHCFGCGKGGDLIRFAMDMENLSFVEALDFLAEIAGVELPQRKGKGPSRDTVETLRAINQEAMTFYHHQLTKHNHALQYLHERGIEKSTVDLFKLGFAPNQWEALQQHLHSRFEPAMLQQSGLFREGKRGNPFDLFRDRIIFPIIDHYGHVIAFGGRLIEGDGPKYINSPETPIYKKGQYLFNLNFAKGFLKKKDHPVVVVEGYMDAIQVYQAGVGTVIAGLGTAFTLEQAKLLKRYSHKVVLNFDGDPAGFKAARASIETFLKADMDIGIVSLPDQLDPDDFVKQQGIEAYREHLDKADNFYAFLMAYLARNRDITNDPRERSHVAQEICGTLQWIEDPVVQSFYLDRLGEDLKLSKAVVTQILQQKTEPSRPSSPARNQNSSASIPKLIHLSAIEREFLFHVMHQSDFNLCLREDHREIMPKILHHLFHDKPWILDFIYCDVPDIPLEERLAVIPEDIRPQIRAIHFDEAFKAEDHDRLETLFPELLRQMLKKMLGLNKRRLQTLPPHEEQKIRLLRKQINEYMKQFHALS